MQQLTKDIQNSLKQDFSEYLNDIEDEVNMDQFYVNLQELKDETIQDEPAFNKIRKNKIKSKENCFMQSVQKMPMKNLTPKQSQEKLVYRVSTPKNDKIKSEKQILTKRLEKVNSQLRKELNKPLMKKTKSKSGNFDQFYQRSQKYLSRSKEKVKQLQKEQNLENTKELTFNPKTNNNLNGKKRQRSTSFIQKIEQKEEQKKMKIQQQRKDLQKQKEKEMLQECSFKPKLKLNTKVKRSLSNLFEWKNLQEQKKAQLQEKYLNDTLKRKDLQSSKSTKKNNEKEKTNKTNGGQRLYQQFRDKQQQQKIDQVAKASERKVKKVEVRKKSYSKSFKVINLDPKKPNYLQKNKQLISTMKKNKSKKNVEKSEPKKQKLNYSNFRDLKNFFDQLKNQDFWTNFYNLKKSSFQNISNILSKSMYLFSKNFVYYYIQQTLQILCIVIYFIKISIYINKKQIIYKENLNKLIYNNISKLRKPNDDKIQNKIQDFYKLIHVFF